MEAIERSHQQSDNIPFVERNNLTMRERNCEMRGSELSKEETSEGEDKSTPRNGLFDDIRRESEVNVCFRYFTAD